MTFRKLLTGAAAAALVTAGGLVLPVAAATAAPAEGATPGVCTDLNGVQNTAAIAQPVDENVNVYVGHDFTRASGAELEGQLVVNGDVEFQTDKDYNLGWVGVGSGLVPVEGQDILRVGGNVTVDPNSVVRVSSYEAGGAVIPGNVRAGGVIDPKSSISLEAPTGSTMTDSADGETAESALGSTFSHWPDDGFNLLSEIASRNLVGDEGTVSADQWLVTLDGTADSDRQLFTLDASDLATGKTPDLKIGENIDFDDVIVIKITGKDVDLLFNGVYGPAGAILSDSEEFADLASHILWVLPDAETVHLGGGAQIPGSIIAPNPSATTTFGAPGMNGRVWVAGSLVHEADNPSTGSEFHAYPFLGDPDMGCGEPPVPTDGETPVEPTEVAPVAPEVTQAVCTEDGTVTGPELDLGSTEGVTYSTDKDAAAGETVTVTATADDGYELSDADGWTLSADKKSATFEVVFDDPACEPTPVEPTEVAPVAPEVTQAVCTEDGTVTGPELDLGSTEGVTYSTDKDAAAGETVTVTATADDGYELSDADGWTLSADKKSATFEVVFDDPACEPTPVEPTEVAPVAPEVTQAACTEDGTVTGPELDLGSTEGVTYSTDKDAAAGETVTVTATADDGYELSDADGWTLSADKKSATFEVVFDDPACEPTPVEPTEVAPVAPEVTQAVCTEDGTVTGPELDLGSTEGVTYSTDKDAAAGETVTVTATADDGYELSDADGWTLSADKKSATFEVVFDDPACEPTPVEPTEVAPVAPEIEQAVCTEDGGVSDPTLTLPETEGIDYTVDGPAQAGDDVTVTATAKDGYVLAGGGNWIAGSNPQKTATLKIHFDDVTCDDSGDPTPGDQNEVAPVLVKVTDAVCTEDGTIVDPIVNRPADTDAIHYTIDGDVAAGGVVTVTAKAQGSHYFSAATGWKLSADNKTATLTVNLDDPQCADATLVDPDDPSDSAAASDPSSSDDSSVTVTGNDVRNADDATTTDAKATADDPEGILAVTGGTNILPGLLVGGIMLLAGAGAVLFARRRTRQN